MRTLFFAVALATAIAFVATSSAPAATTTHCGSGFGPTKYSSIETIKGKQVIVNCGPAIAKLHYKGTTYTFKHGTCFHYARLFKLNLGNSPLVPTTSNHSYTNMTITATPSDRAEIGAAIGNISLYITAKWSGPASKGTFTSITNGVTATGSWNCGEPIR